ncbi:MAG: alpha/beta hydrolase family protein, partial [Myxococcota bacterium]
MLLLLLACTSPADDTTDTGTPAEVDLVASLVAPGPHRVGYRQSSVTYTDDVSTDRALRLALWFPTEAEDGDEAAYLDGAIEAPDVLDDPAPAPGTLPVAVFSHGHLAFAESSSFLAEHLASHGWVVASPDHTGNTTFDPSDRPTEMYLQRPRDLSAVLDALPGELDVDTSAVPALGHSYGGYTVLAMAGATYDAAVIAGCDDGTPFCSTMTPTLAEAFAQGARDPRVVAAVPMAAGDYRLFGADGIAAIALPVLQMTG